MSKSGSGYTAYCLDWKSKKEKEGHRFENLREVRANDDCFNAWKKESEEVKDYYRLIAKCEDHHSRVGERSRRNSFKSRSSKPQRSFQRSSQSSKRSGSVQARLDLPHLDRKFKGTFEEYMELLITSRNQRHCLQNLNFYIAHANYFYIREMDNGNSDFYPVEIAVAECSLENGVQRIHHVMVKEDIFKGYRNDAITRSQESHKIPIDLNFDFKVEVETDYSEIYQGICNFIEPGSINGELPPVFTMVSNNDYIWRPVKSIFGRLAVASGKHPQNILIYPFEELFAYVSQSVKFEERGQVDVAEAISNLEKDPNAYRNGFGCEFHKRAADEGELHCSSSFVRRWWYRLCDSCCESLGIEKIPGAHGPETQLEPLVLKKMSLKPKFNDSRYPRDQKRYFKYE